MSVAETSALEAAPPRAPHVQLATHSLVGGALLLLAVWVILGGLPWFWSEGLQAESLFNEFLSSALLFVITLLAVAGFIILFRKLERKYEQPGLRAGVVLGAFTLFIALWLSRAFGAWMETRELGMAGLVLTLGFAAGMAFLVYKLYFRPAWAQRLQSTEEKGWFHATSYKGNQGLKVRRGTIMGVLTVGACGIITMISHRSLGSDRYGPNDWEWTIPFTSYTVDAPVVPGAKGPPPVSNMERYIPLMYKVHITVPLILAILLFWFAWRLVNWPAFADFLIATEAEMNKVSWTTRKRLIQDTIVVLVTVFLLTVFLFFVDILWIKVLSWRWINVLQVDVKAEVKKQQEKSQW